MNDTFAHNTRSELTAATVNGSNYEYAYDNIGNRQQATEGNDVTAYDTNALNQYTSISENGAAAFVPLFDADGNQTLIKTETGIWSAVYNAENRPVTFTNSESNTIVECQYDSMGRRAYKKVTVNGSVTLHQRYVYRGYLQIACIDLTRSHHPVLWLITWDPSQPEATRPLAIQKDGTWYTYGWDLTKNICELYSSNGYIITSYSYAPFGAVTTTGHVTQPIQWSSEMFDIELMLNYYNYRFYNEKIGRMIVMDYIERMNPYDFLNNDSIGSYDYLGLWKDLGNHRWCAENGDTLQSLASKYQASEKDSDCLWPENDSKSYYPSVRVNDIYDASNLCIGCGGKVLNYETFKDFMARHARVYGLISGDETSASLTNLKLNFVLGKEIANKLKDESGEGATPIVRLIIAGHGVVNPKTKKTVGIGSGKNYFSPSKWLKENEEKQTYERAKSRKGPKRCWFRRDSYVKFIGCNTNLLAKTFAEKVLRRNSMAEGTNHSIRHIKPGNTLEYKEDTEWITSSPADTSVTWQPHHGIL